MTVSRGGDWCEVCRYPVTPGEPCRYCRDKRAEAKKTAAALEAKQIEDLGGKLAYEDFRLDTFRKTPRNGAVLDVCGAFDPDKVNLYLNGPAGAGKTHLATGAARLHRGALVLKSTQILRACKRAALEKGSDEGMVIKKLVQTPVLVIDDLGVEKLTEFAITCIYEIIDGRIMAKRNGLIVTSNLTLKALAAKFNDDRIPSRLAGLCRNLDLSGERDFRLTSKGE